MTTPATISSSQAKSINTVAEVEAEISQCLQGLLSFSDNANISLSEKIKLFEALASEISAKEEALRNTLRDLLTKTVTNNKLT